MQIPRILNDELLYTTVRIQTNIGTGTGFFFSFKANGNQHFPVIITNKHVVEGATHGKFLVHEATKNEEKALPTNKSFTFEVPNFLPRWVMHPDKNVDLCAMPSLSIDDLLSKDNRFAYTQVFKEENIWTDEHLLKFPIAEDILMVGYPKGLWDEFNLLPLVRRGIAASHPALDYGGKSEFVIDAACFPGSSGSPVIGTIGNQVVLLGVLHAGPIHDARGRVYIKDIPLFWKPKISTHMIIHLGYVVKAKELLVLKEVLFKKYNIA